MSEAQAYVGIDVSKAELEVVVGEEGWTVSNDESGIETLLEQLRERPIELVVLEATGGHETPAAAVLAEAGLPVVKSRVVCKSERKLLDASVRLPWRPPSVREA